MQLLMTYESAKEAEFMARRDVNSYGVLKPNWFIKAEKKPSDKSILYRIYNI